MTPSSGGAQGVIFVWDWNTPISSSASFVIKPLAGSAAPAKFAEFMLDKVGGAESPGSQPIERRSPVGDAIVTMLQAFQKAMPKDSDEEKRWNAVTRFYDSAQTFLLQDTQTGITEMADSYREVHGLRKILRDASLMRNLGQLFAADAIIGNGDRLCQVNTGNIIFRADGTLSAIDSTTVLTNYHALAADTNLAKADLEADTGGSSPSQWADNMIHGRHGQVATAQQAEGYDPLDPSTPRPVLAPGFTLKLLFDVDGWWEKYFRGHFEASLSNENRERAKQRVPPLVPPRADEWSLALATFKEGLETGLRAADEWLSGFKWLQVKSTYQGYVSRFGGDPNLDWTNLKVRRIYFKARRAGADDGQAMAAVNEYVERKFPGV